MLAGANLTRSRGGLNRTSNVMDRNAPEVHYITHIIGTLLYFTYFSRTLLPSASSGYTIGRLSLTQLLTSIIEIPISLYHLGTSSSHRFRGLPLGRRPPGCITSALLWGAVGVILLMCDHHLILFLLAVCCAGCMFTRRLISSFLTLSILVFPAAFLRHLISVVVNICLSLLVRVQFSLW